LQGQIVDAVPVPAEVEEDATVATEGGVQPAVGEVARQAGVVAASGVAPAARDDAPVRQRDERLKALVAAAEVRGDPAAVVEGAFEGAVGAVTCEGALMGAARVGYARVHDAPVGAEDDAARMLVRTAEAGADQAGL